MNISVFGLGYVGAVTAGCLAKAGHNVIGVDVQTHKVAEFNRGLPPILEPGLAEVFRDARQQKRLRATENGDEAVAATNLSIVCVGTPSTAAGALDLSFVRGVIAQIAGALRQTSKAHVLVLRSTMLPGSTAALANELLGDLERSGRLKVFYFPEFLRESTAVADFENPSLAVVGSRDGAAPPSELMRDLFGERAAVVNWQTAEMIKYACNAFHAAKITFANEVGRAAKQFDVDSRVVMKLLCEDTRLNLSPYYLRPGNPFGGSCLPKDLRALTNCARHLGLNLPMLENVLPSNERHLQSLLELITRGGEREVVILGLTFKPHTDDLRESPMVEVAQTLLGRGYELRIYDPALNLAALVGANKRVVDVQMPHLSSLLKADLSAAIGARGVVVAAHQCVPAAELKRLLTPQHRVIDVNGWPELRETMARYEGFCW